MVILPFLLSIHWEDINDNHSEFSHALKSSSILIHYNSTTSFWSIYICVRDISLVEKVCVWIHRPLKVTQQAPSRGHNLQIPLAWSRVSCVPVHKPRVSSANSTRSALPSPLYRAASNKFTWRTGSIVYGKKGLTAVGLQLWTSERE